MDIRNQGRALHACEIPGFEKVKRLPFDWYTFTNLELRDRTGTVLRDRHRLQQIRKRRPSPSLRKLRLRLGARAHAIQGLSRE
jgi:hypothetical protein